MYHPRSEEICQFFTKVQRNSDEVSRDTFAYSILKVSIQLDLYLKIKIDNGNRLEPGK